MTSPYQQSVKEVCFVDASLTSVSSTIGRCISPYNKQPYHVERVPNLGWEARQQGLKGQPVTYPLIAYSISQMEDANDFMWNKQALFNGLYYRDKTKPGVLKQAKLSYQKVTLTVSVQTEDARELLNIVKRWKFRERKAQFNVTGEGLQVTVKCLFDSSFAFPQQAQGDTGNIFSIETSVVLYTYIGEIVEIPSISEVDVVLGEQDVTGKVLSEVVVARKRRMRQ